MIEIGTEALKAQCLAMPFVSLGIVCNMTFQSVGKSWTATILSSARQGIFFVPLIYLLPSLFGLAGVEIAQPVADGLTFLLCVPFALIFFRTLPHEPDAA